VEFFSNLDSSCSLPSLTCCRVVILRFLFWCFLSDCFSLFYPSSHLEHTLMTEETSSCGKKRARVVASMCTPRLETGSGSQPTLQSNVNTLAVTFRSMERARSTLEDFVLSYFMFFGLEASISTFFQFMPTLVFVESCIYEMMNRMKMRRQTRMNVCILLLWQLRQRIQRRVVISH
jgi:hypothetical protein